MARAFLVGQRNSREFVGVIDAGHPHLDGCFQIAVQDCGDAFFVHSDMSRRIGEFLMDDFGDLAQADRFHKNLVGLQKDGGHGRLEHGVVAEHERYSLGLCVAHSIDHGEPIGGIRHVEVGEQYIEVFGRDESQGFAYGDGGHHFKAVAFQALLIRNPDVFFVFRKQNSRFFHHRIGLPKGTRISRCGHSEQEPERIEVPTSIPREI